MLTVTPEDVLAWGKVNREPTTEELDMLEVVIAAAGAYVEEYCTPLDEDAPDETQEAVMTLAAIMQSFRLWKRRETPEGITAVFDGIAAMRVTGFDPDITRLIQIYPSWGVA